MNARDVVSNVNRHMLTLRRHAPLIDELLCNLSSLGDVSLFGGAIRDIAVYGDHACPRDYDFVVAGDALHDIGEVLSQRHIHYQRNRFGGFKIHIGPYALDVWALHSTWAFRSGYVSPDVHRLPQTVFLNVDAITMDLANGTLHEHGFFQALKSKTLDIVLRPNPDPTLNVLRTLVFCERYRLKQSAALREYLHDWFQSSSSPVESLRRAEMAHYGYPVLKGWMVESLSGAR